MPPPPAPSGGDGPSSADISPGGEDAAAPQVAVAPDGISTVVWSGQAGAAFSVYARRIAPDGTPGPINQLSAPSQDALTPQVAVAPDGTATCVWIRSDGFNFVVQERRVAPGGALEATKDLSAPGRDASEPQVAVAPDATATVVWNRFDGSNFIVERRGLAPDGTPTPGTENLSAAGRSAGGAQLTAGALTTIWERFDGANDIVQGVTDPKPAALLTPASHDFGSIQLGTGGSSDHLFKLFNSGNAPLSVSSISVGGPDADQFSLTGTGSCTGAPLLPGSSCEFSAAFEPSTAGRQVAAIEVLSDAVSSPDAALLAGTAVAPGSSGSSARPIRIDNSFKIGRPLLNRKKGTARLPVTVPGAGTLILVGSGVATLPVAGPGTVRMNVRARGRKSELLNRNGSVALRLALTFVPTGGEPSTQKTTLRLRKR